MRERESVCVRVCVLVIKVDVNLCKWCEPLHLVQRSCFLWLRFSVVVRTRFYSTVQASGDGLMIRTLVIGGGLDQLILVFVNSIREVGGDNTALFHRIALQVCYDNEALIWRWDGEILFG